MINGLFDVEFRMEHLTQNGDPLVRLYEYWGARDW
jgi:hypothetical protein